LIESQSESTELTSFSQLVYEIIGGSLRRHTFTPREMELLLDLEQCTIRKSARPELLRRYLRAVQQQRSEDNTRPLRLSVFIQTGGRKRNPAKAEDSISATETAPGLSSK
jgi:hypothetical protein